MEKWSQSTFVEDAQLCRCVSENLGIFLQRNTVKPACDHPEVVSVLCHGLHNFHSGVALDNSADHGDEEAGMGRNSE